MGKGTKISDREDWYREEFERISNKIKIKTKDKLNLGEFHRIRNFKIRLVSRSGEKEVKEVTQEAFSIAKRNPSRAIEILRRLDGIGIPIISAILAMKFPDNFAIIDVNAINGIHHHQRLKKIVSLKTLKDWLRGYKTNSKIYLDYNSFLNKHKGGQNLRNLEYSLYLLGKKEKKIKLTDMEE